MKTAAMVGYALQNVIRRRGRSALCMVAVSVGILFVMLISAAGRMLTERVDGVLNGLGFSGLIVYSQDGTQLSQAQGERWMNTWDFLDSASAAATKMGAVTGRRFQTDALLLGLDESAAKTMNLKLLYGRMPTRGETEAGSAVMIIGRELAQNLYGRDNCIGKSVWVSGGAWEEKVEIVGVSDFQLGALSSIAGGRIPCILLLPLNTVNRLRGEDTVEQYFLRCGETEDVAACSERMTAAFAAQGDHLVVENVTGYMDLARSLAGAVADFLFWIAILSLVVAGIGVANFMLSSTRERKKEIGLYLALGMSPRQVTALFWMESMLICLFSGLMGAGASAIVIGIFCHFSGMTVILPGEALGQALVLSCLCGALAGLAPAWKAAGMQPISSLRET